MVVVVVVVIVVAVVVGLGVVAVVIVVASVVGKDETITVYRQRHKTLKLLRPKIICLTLGSDS